MKKYLLLLAIAIATMSLVSCDKSGGKTIALIETDMGNMKVELYNSTPGHRDNFVKLAKEGYYNDLLFHRVIKGFMVQGGDPDSRGAAAGQRLGMGGPGYTIPAEIGAAHIKGTLAAARTGGPSNPEKKSSGSQFYIVQGNGPMQEAQIQNFAKQKGITYSAEDIAAYKELGGTPALDNDYTVFGKVIEGLEVVDKIAATQTAPGDRPVTDVKMKISIL